MNIIVLTPDRLGSTLLQRVLTVQMNYIKNSNVLTPVSNLHDLSNGLDEYYSNKFKKKLLIIQDKRIYNQSLTEVISLLKTYTKTQSMTCRLAHYHMLSRQDNITEREIFYKYINENFFIITCKRNNIFEYALSEGIKKYANIGNIYVTKQRFEILNQMYNNQISITQTDMIKFLNRYKDYENWTNENFNVNDTYVYENNVNNIDSYIKGLKCFNDIEVPLWDEIFDIGWNDWNKCHRIISDLPFISNNNQHLLEDKTRSNNGFINGAKVLPKEHQQFLYSNLGKYMSADTKIKKMASDKLLHSGLPIKMQTLLEKKLMIKNFNECLDVYNTWALKFNYNTINNIDGFIQQSEKEYKYWYGCDKNAIKKLTIQSL